MITDGLVGYWPLDGTADDASGNGSHGTLIDSPMFVAGQLRLGILLDGVSQHVDLGDPEILRLTGAMTVSAWVNVTSFDAGRILARSSSSPFEKGYEFRVTGSSTAQFTIASDSSTEIEVLLDTTFPTGQWTHLAGSYEPSTALRIYLNGALNNSNTTSIPASQFNSSLNVRIGARDPTATVRNFDGVIDDLRVYNRVLSDAEIAAIYAASTAVESVWASTF